MADFINTIDALGDDAVIDSIIDRSITEFKDDTLTTIGQYAFSKCTALTEVNFPNVTTIKPRAFWQASISSALVLPKVERIEDYAFNATGLMKSLCLPKLEYLGYGAFEYCTGLLELDVPSCTTISTAAFRGAPLNTLILRNETTVCTLLAAMTITWTPIGQGTGYIYVPAALKSQYEQATNWSEFAARFRALEDYTVDGTTTGELDETKI